MLPVWTISIGRLTAWQLKATPAPASLSAPRTRRVVSFGILRVIAVSVPVQVSEHGSHHPWDLEEIDQVWAEAIQAYKDGESLFLSGEVAQMAYAKQQEAMESDDREGLVQDYLDRLLPENWDNMDLYQRAYLPGWW